MQGRTIQDEQTDHRSEKSPRIELDVPGKGEGIEVAQTEAPIELELV